MKILITGSSGQIGSALTKYLIKKGHEVIEFDIENDPSQDLRIENTLDFLLPEIDFVYFLAFDVGGARYLHEKQNTFDFIKNNMLILINTFNSINKYNKKFIFASSQMSNMIDSSYGTLKRIGEFYTKVSDGVIVKFWNIYGHENNKEKFHVITDFINMAKNSNEITVIGDGNEERQFLFVDDCCECLNILMNNYEFLDKKKTFDISSFKWVKIIDIANVISREFNNCKIHLTGKSINIQKNNKVSPKKDILSVWKPKTSLVDGIKSIIEQMKNDDNNSV